MRLFFCCGIISCVFGITFFGLLHIKIGKIYPQQEVVNFTFTVHKNESLNSIARRLKHHRLIISNKLFQYGARVKGLDKIIKYGEFALTNKMSTNDILKKITSSDYVKYKITIKECVTSWEIIKLFSQKNFLIDNLTTSKLKEGIFAPDTYTVSFETTFTDLLEVMRLQQKMIVDGAWSRRKADHPIKNKFELLILASIIEKEAATSEEMQRISSVFVNRLRIGMRLQSDPTVSYGMDLGNIDERLPLQKEHLRAITDHNTYRIPRLPISPICNPGKHAIEAAANPAATKFLYFVMSESGNHAFAQNFEDHKRNVSKWREYKQNEKNASD